MFSGFQSNSFQRNAWQILSGGAVPAPPAPNGNRRIEYTPTSYELENARRKLQKFKDEEREAKVELLSIDYKLEELELRRLRDLADESLQLELIALLRQQQIFQQIYNELQNQRMMEEDNELLILLASLPFNSR